MRVALVVLALAFVGCTPRNWFRSYYVPKTVPPGVYVPTPARPSGDARAIDGGSRRVDDRRLLADGYVWIGTSKFTCSDCASQYAAPARRAANTIGADIVVIYRRNAGTKTEQHTEQVDSGQYETEYSTEAVFNASTNQYEAEQVAHTVELKKDVTVETRHARTAYDAEFWVKAQPDPFGVYAAKLSAAGRAALRGGPGVPVLVVVRGSPAAAAGISAGDLLTAFDDTPLGDATALHAAVRALAGKRVTVQGVHHRKPFAIAVTFGAAPVSAVTGSAP